MANRVVGFKPLRDEGEQQSIAWDALPEHLAACLNRLENIKNRSDWGDIAYRRRRPGADQGLVAAQRQALVTGGILALAVVFGWQAWQKYQTNQAQGASIVYQQLIETAR